MMADAIDIEEESDELSITPLGAGQEVGRSCILLKFKGKRIILDCGIHPGLRTKDCLPFLDGIDDFSAIDLVLISHFHLDHSGGLPVLLQQVGPKTRCFMTPPTKAIYRWLLADYVRVSSSAGGGGSDSVLFSDRDIVSSLELIETVDFHSELEVAGVKFTAFHAGHVLGAAMFMIEIAGVKVLYTGDFSRQEDRHLMCAEIPPTVPDVLITESTYGTHIHDKREEREARFTGLVYDIVTRGGRCLIPAFALGRAQELMLILDEFWDNHPELHSIPIYYASQLARKCMSVYQTYVHSMNERVRRRLVNNNPFVFRHIANLKNMDQFDDTGPCVIMASPGMMQSGLSRELFENWCTDRRNGVIIAGYCVEGTLAKLILSHPSEVPTTNGQTLPLKCSVDYISFSAHTDYQQTSDFVRQLKPAHIVLVHGEKNEMLRLKGALSREYEDDETYNIDLYAPKNGESVLLHFRGEKMAKVLGEMAITKPHDGLRLSGVLIKKNFSYHIIKPSDLPSYTDLATSTVTQRLTAKFTGPPSLLHYHLTMMCGNVQVLKHRGDRQQFLVMGAVEVTWEPRMVVLEWQSNPVNDMFADAVQTVLLNAELEGMPWQGIPQIATLDRPQFRDSFLQLLRDMFGAVELQMKGSDGLQLVATINDTLVEIDTGELTVSCSKDLKLEKVIRVALHRLYHNLMPVRVETA